MSTELKPNTGRKLFFGLFVFPLLIAVGMAVLLCAVIFLTHEEETAESLITAIKTGSPSKRWQKAFELSNEINRAKAGIRSESVMKEIIHILTDPNHYDPKTRGYMALAVSRFERPEAVQALRQSLSDESRDVQLYALWGLGALRAKEAEGDIAKFLQNENGEMRKMSAYVLGVIGARASLERLKMLLEDPVNDVQWNVALSLARLGDDAGSPVLLKMLDRQLLEREGMPEAQIEKVMINAAKGLALIKRPEFIKILETVARSERNLKVRQAAINALQYGKNETSALDKLDE